MPTRNRLSIVVALFAALVALVALLGVGSAAAGPKIPKIPKVVERQVPVKASGTVTYRWTYDNREKCTPGYSKTIEEELRFNFPTRNTKMVTIGPAKLVMPALRGGTSQYDVRVGGWQTTNYCSPTPKAKEPPEPTCRSGASPLVLAITNTIRDVPSEDEEELAPLSRESQIVIGRTQPFAQKKGCNEERPRINFEYEHELGWHADPGAGVALGMGVGTTAYAKLTKGKTIRRQIQISGGCGSASAHASAVSGAPHGITKCTLEGVVFVTVKGI
ncbi:MAG: hypothetical protein JST59_24845 [Actinobacteria bacterium]|nr:hypothetical protein [Actinomycetota bacterium]